MATAAADRHLLFGLLALQNGLIDQGQLMLAFHAWTLDKSKSLADHLEARGDLTAAKRALLDALAKVHLEAHDGDVEKSLAAVPANRSTRARLAELGEPEIQATLARVARAKVGQAPGFVAGPGLEGGDELALVNQAVLQREQSEEEMAVGGGSHGMAPNSGGRWGAGPSLGAGPGIQLHRADYCRFAMRLHPYRRARSDSPGGRTDNSA